MTDEPADARPPDPGPAEGPGALGRIAALLESRVVPALERIALALERAPIAGPAPDLRAVALAELRRAIREADVARGGALLDDFRSVHPEAPELPGLVAELAEARQRAIDDRRQRLEAARAANDADAVLTLRNTLAELATPDELEPLDRELLRWVMGLLMKRMRTGTVRADVATLAARVAESYGHRPEGASLRASLPTLRRSAGLCPRCAAPFLGEEDACPPCLAGAPKIADLPETPSPPT